MPVQKIELRVQLDSSDTLLQIESIDPVLGDVI
jgi:hypothetical protein